jgi:hypothetical protein
VLLVCSPFVPELCIFELTFSMSYAILLSESEFPSKLFEIKIYERAGTNT